MRASSPRIDRWNRALKTQEIIRDPRSGARYGIQRLIGRGGYSEVYEVVELGSHQHFALKCLRLKHADDPRAVERARREGGALRRLDHPNVVRCHGLGVREDGLVWMVLDLLEGRALRELTNTLGRVPIPWALELGIAICEGLRAVHGVCVHRDLKPENVHVSDDGKKICLLDLGVGKFSHEVLLTTGEISLGTIVYMSPEQLEYPTTIDARSDLFSLGIMLYEMMAGAHPFCLEGLGSIDRMAVGLRIISTEHAPLHEAAPWVPSYVSQFIEVALRKSREKRFGSAEAMGRALRGALGRYAFEHGPSAPLGLVGSLPHEPSPFESEPEDGFAAPSDIQASVNPYVTAPLSPEAPVASPSARRERASTPSEAPPPSSRRTDRSSFAAIELRKFDVAELRAGLPPARRVPLGGAKLKSAPVQGPPLSEEESVVLPVGGPGRLGRLAVVVITGILVAWLGIRLFSWAASGSGPAGQPADAPSGPRPLEK